jgi:hypothetical protein
MIHTFKGLGVVSCLVLAPTLAVVPGARAQSTPSTAAYVYIQIQGPEGAVYGFRSSSTGQLTAIPGAPWKPAGLIIGDNKSVLVTMGEDNLHSYGIASNGAIQSQLEQNPDTDYAGGECGNGNGGAVLDHTGQYVYVLQQNGGDGSCAAYQTFQILNSGAYKGVFDGVGDTEENTSGGASVDLPSILGNETFAYADQFDGHSNSVIGFQRTSSGALQLIGVMNPTFPGSAAYTPYHPDSSPDGNYVVLQLYPNDSGKGQLGSFTVDSDGNLSSTNTADTMPNSPFYITGTTFSPSGNMFVAYADNGAGNPGLGNGIQIYNFNGAAPLTAYKTLLNGTPIDQVGWDSSSHMYAISQSTNTLYVFTVTPTSVTQDASWSIGSPYKMIVVSE